MNKYSDNQMMADIERIIISEEELQEMVARVGAQISRDYAGKNLVLVSILSVPLFQLLGFPAPERLALVLLAAGLTYTLGKLNRDREKLLRKLLKLKPAA